MDDYRSKLDQAQKLFAQHNYLRIVNRIDTEEFFRMLVILGGTSSESLKRCTEEDLVECGLPKLIARQVLDIFQETLPEGVLETGKVAAASNE